MKIKKYTLLVLLGMCPLSLFSSMGQIQKVMSALTRKKLSVSATLFVNDSIKKFVTNQSHIRDHFREIIPQAKCIVKDFDIPEQSKKELREKLQPFTTSPVFYHFNDDGVTPEMQALKAFEAVGVGMNKAAVKAFWNNDKKVSGSINFNLPQMNIIVDHECCHIKNGDGDTLVLLKFLLQNKKHLSKDEFDTVLAAFGEDFFYAQKALFAAIAKDAQEMGIYDLRTIEDFDLHETAYVRYFEARVDATILGTNDEQKVRAYRDYYQNRYDSPAHKERERLERLYINHFLKNGQPIPLEVATFTWPTDKERADTCSAKLATIGVATK